jgi:prolyl 4-hydroxylase
VSSPSFIEIYSVDKKLCDDLIQFHKESKLYKSKGHVGSGEKTVYDYSKKESTDVTFHNDTNHETIHEFFRQLSIHAQTYVNKFSITNDIKTSNTNLISMFPPLGGFKYAHYERGSIATSRRQLVYMLYLNTVTDGGGTEFIHQKIITNAEKGKLVIWPADFTHLHRGIVSPTEIKYIATGWLDIKL